MARTPVFNAAVLVVASLLGACHNQGEPSNGKVEQAIEIGRQQSQQQAASDPAQQPHPSDPNPLRRKLGDLQIRELFFGPSQTQGDWIAYLPCSQLYAGMTVAAANRIYLKRCLALQQYLLARAGAGGFHDVEVRDVMDPHISGADTSEPRP